MSAATEDWNPAKPIRRARRNEEFDFVVMIGLDYGRVVENSINNWIPVAKRHFKVGER